MFDNFLTSILQVVIVIDVLGAIAYFVLGGLKRKKRQALEQSGHAQPAEVIPLHEPFWKRFSWGHPRPIPATEGDFDQLRQVLYSYREGLA
ncbi:MAG: hypothetical protein HOC74_24685 [Gemmatimonadetes bacterium]|mgnify:CR=1 FL=1|jgi:hypothetical protein|nr:hypothetical protein [Gemmatimonadota bacterium]